nr:GNAT family N-acetyltransferase [Alphaproteobacteria bacterium]
MMRNAATGFLAIIVRSDRSMRTAENLLIAACCLLNDCPRPRYHAKDDRVLPLPVTVETLAPVLKQVPLPFRTSTASLSDASGTTDSGLRFEVVSTVSDFEALGAEWDSLLAKCGSGRHVFQQHSWLSHWAQTFLNTKGKRLCVVVGRHNGQVVVIWPLVWARKFGASMLEWMGDPVSQYSDVVVEGGPRSREYLQQSIQFIRRSLGADFLLASKVREDSNVAGILCEAGGRVLETEKSATMYLETIQTLKDLDSRLGRTTAKSRRRRRKQLLEAGAQSYVVYSEGEKALEVVDLALRFKEDWFRKHGIISRAYSDPRFGAFWKRVALGTDRPVGLRAGVLELDGRPVAVELGLVYKERHHAHVGAFDIEFEATSPGLAQLEAQVLECAREGIAKYDLLAPLSAYKEKLA